MFGLPFLTFLSLIVTAASVVIAIAWALYDRSKEG